MNGGAIAAVERSVESSCAASSAAPTGLGVEMVVMVVVGRASLSPRPERSYWRMRVVGARRRATAGQDETVSSAPGKMITMGEVGVRGGPETERKRRCVPMETREDLLGLVDQGFGAVGGLEMEDGMFQVGKSRLEGVVGGWAM